MIEPNKFEAAVPVKAPGAACWNCPLIDQPCVPSKLPADAVIAVVGEAPGAMEVHTGEPFVGDSGKLLAKALEYHGVPAERVAKINAVLCRPAHNETPSVEALEACSERLRRELDGLPVQSIVTVGKTATAALDWLTDGYAESRFEDFSIMARRGSWSRPYNDTPVLATLHPAFILRTPNYGGAFVADIGKATRPGVEDFDVSRVKYRVANSRNYQAVLAYLRAMPDGARLSFDIETDDLQWYDTPARRRADLLCIVLCYRAYEVVIVPAESLTAELTAVIGDMLERGETVAHNGKFDQHGLAEYGLWRELSDDTMVMHYTLEETGKHGLKELGARYLNAPDYDSWIDAWFEANKIAKDKRRYSMLPREKLYEYAAIDGALTLELAKLLEYQLRVTGMYELYRMIYMPVANMLTQVEANGIHVDRDWLERVRQHMQSQLIRLTQKANDLVLPMVAGREAEFATLFRLMTKRVPDPDATGRVKTKPVTRFNPGSDKQVSIILYDVLRLKHTRKLIKPTSTNTGKDALDALPPNPVADVVREYRRVEKLLTTYVESLLARADVNDLIHVNFKITGTETGRISADNGDHGIPRPEADDIADAERYGAMIRSAFVAGADDYVLIDADYSQLELRIFAHYSEEPFLVNAYQNGEDVHNKTAELLEKLGTPFFAGYSAGSKALKKDRRVVAKNVNFGGLVYLGGAAGISGMIGGRVPVPILAQTLRYYETLLPVAKRWQKEQLLHLRKYGYVETLFGSRRRIPVLTDANFEEARKASVNAKIQGTAGILNNLAAVALVRAGYCVVHLVHDSILVRVRRADAERARDDIRQIMIDTASRYITRVPIDVDAEIVERWSKRPTF